MTQLAPELERKLSSAVEKMPAFPKSVQKILELTRNINCLPKELVGVIEKDPVMTMKILRVINSAYYGLPSKVTSVNQSVVYLGLNTVKNLALSFATIGILPKTNSAGFDIQRYLLHSLATASVARHLNQVYFDGEGAGDCFVAGLLHDFGKVVFAQFLPEEFKQCLEASQSADIPLHQLEAEIIGAHHGVVGAMLAKRWQFDDHLTGLIRDHHLAGKTPEPVLACLKIADQICRGSDLLQKQSPEAWAGQLSCVSDMVFEGDLSLVVARLGDIARIIGEANLFVQVDTGQ